jgi:hypothetical protein
LARTEVRELLELAVLDAVRDGLISP